MPKYSVEHPSPLIRKRARNLDTGVMKGSESGRAARFTALDKMIMRRRELKKAQAGSPGGTITQRSPGPSADEMEEMINPGYKKRKGY